MKKPIFTAGLSLVALFLFVAPVSGANKETDKIEDLTAYLQSNNEYQTADVLQRLKHLAELKRNERIGRRNKILADLHENQTITPFARSDFEAPLVAAMLMKDESFRKADLTTKKQRIEKLHKDKAIHTFTRRKVRRILDLPR